MTKSSVLGFMAGIGAGAATMYFLDPDRGARRRALFGDKVTSASRKMTRAVEVTKRDLSNRGYGMLMEARHLFSHEDVPDDVLEARIRSKMGRSVSNPHGIQVSCQGGSVKLSGSIDAAEKAALLRCINAVPGVNAVENNLEEHGPRQGVSPAVRENNANKASAKFTGDRPQPIH